jgi:diguanylate cyclase (GGDEF)-like protein/PAS domain S-box-containing protein
MEEELRILILDDTPGEEELILRALRSGGLDFSARCVSSTEQFARELEDFKPDLILSDCEVSGFQGLSALSLAKEKFPDVPFLYLSATNDAAAAVEALHSGASDYLSKDRLSHLAPSLLRARKESRERIRRKQIDLAIRTTQENYELAVRGANDGLWHWDLLANRLFFSPRWKTMLGYEEHEIGDSPEELFRLIHPEDLERVKTKIRRHLKNASPHYEDEHRILHKDGTYIWTLSRGLAVRNAAGEATRMAGSQTNISDRKRAEEELVRSALYDPLTGLANRALFAERLAHAASLSTRGDYHFAVLLLDLDRFKLVNDSLGHAVGDKLLIGIARRLESCLRPGDTVARLGGDEFTILLHNISDLADATAVAERIHKEFALRFHWGGHDVFTSASIGIALSMPEYSGGSDDMLRDADIAMYRAKALGRARFEVFNQEMHARAASSLELEGQLRRALGRHEFVVHYQPIVSLENGRITSCEALVRWNHPTRGLIGPGEFIPIAEETGVITSLGEWVLKTACAQAKAWQEEGLPALSVAVNLSARQFRGSDLCGTVGHALEATGLEAGRLELELTESVIMDGAEEAAATLQQLKTLGVRLSLDDFGTGYSSLSYLKRFPFNTLKMDRSFVSELPRKSEDAAIAKAIISLAHGLSLSVIAEGVETLEQLAFLGTHECDEAQGYLFSRAISAEQFGCVLRDGRGLLLPKGVAAENLAAPEQLH